MHAGSAQMMGMANSFWPLAYSLKSYDLSLHPAFLPSAYRMLPTSQYTPTHGHTNGQTQSPSPTHKSDKFTIDAILNRDKNVESDRSSGHDDVQKPLSDYRLPEKDSDEIMQRRQQRFLEASHPYLSHHSNMSEKSYLQKHLPSPYKQFTEGVRQEKADKKSSQITSPWSKPSKGKRVRTIFTPEQLERMEAEFERQQYMVGTERYYLANSLNLTEAQVKVWFQNRRIKWRKQHLEQQQAKLKQMDIYRNAESASDSESDDDTPRDDSSHVGSLIDPFQSPKEMRGTQ